MSEQVQIVTEDWQCIVCERPLIGLPRDGCCPGCGTTIARSLRDDRLAHCHPLWVMKLSQAATLLCFTMSVRWLCDLRLLGAAAVPLSETNPVNHLITRITMILPIMSWLGAWLLATPEYIAPGHYRDRNWCWAIRIAASLALLNHWLFYPITIPFYFVVTYAAPFFGLAALVLKWLYLRKLAMRIPDPWLHAHTPFVLAGLVVAYVFAYVFPAMRLERLMPSLALASSTEGVMMLTTSGYAIFALARFSIRFTEAANDALANYIADPVSDDEPTASHPRSAPVP